MTGGGGSLSLSGSLPVGYGPTPLPPDRHGAWQFRNSDSDCHAGGVTVTAAGGAMVALSGPAYCNVTTVTVAAGRGPGTLSVPWQCRHGAVVRVRPLAYIQCPFKWNKVRISTVRARWTGRGGRQNLSFTQLRPDRNKLDLGGTLAAAGTESTNRNIFNIFVRCDWWCHVRCHGGGRWSRTYCSKMGVVTGCGLSPSNSGTHAHSKFLLGF